MHRVRRRSHAAICMWIAAPTEGMRVRNMSIHN